MRGRRFLDGQDIGPCGPPKPVPDPYVAKLIREAYEAAKEMGPVVEGGEFDLNRFKPLPGRILLVRPPQIKEEGGIALPEAQWRNEAWFCAVKVGDNVVNCAVADRVIFHRGHKPKPIKLGRGGWYIGRDSAVAGIAEPI